MMNSAGPLSDEQLYPWVGAKMKAWIFAGIATVAGCVTTSQVVPAGRDSFMVVASNDACGNCTPPQIRAVKEANVYCGTLSKVMVIRRMDAETFDIGYGKKTTLLFSCLDENDPEYRRPDLRKDPTTIVEDQRKH